MTAEPRTGMLHLLNHRPIRLYQNFRQAAAPLLAAVCFGTVPAEVHAVQPQRFVQTTEADFEPGTFDGLAATAIGDLKLVDPALPLAGLPAGYSIVHAVLEIDDRVLVAVGPDAAVFALPATPEDDAAGEDQAGDAAEPALVPLLSFEEAQIFAAVEREGRLLVGVSSGEGSRVLSVDPSVEPGGAEPIELVSLPDERYIWDLLPMSDGSLLIATGDSGRVFRLPAGGAADGAELLLDTTQANVLCLAGSPGDAAATAYPAFAGTDTDGLVFRIEADGETLAVFDAPQPEVAALAVDGSGNVYLGTADARQARPGRRDGAADLDAGRPEGAVGPTTRPVDAEIPAPPEAPEDLPLPDPLPPQPEPLQGSTGTPTDPAARPTGADDPQGGSSSPPAQEGPPADGAAEVAEAGAASAPDNDALREEIRRRLQTARRTGRLTTGGDVDTRTRPTAALSGADAPDGNGVYRVNPEGFSTLLLGETVVVLDLALDTDPRGRSRLRVATGSEGEIYSIDLDTLDTRVARQLDAEQVSVLRSTSAGPLAGTSNPAAVYRLEPPNAGESDRRTGSYTSASLDAGQPSLWGRLNLEVGGGSGQDDVRYQIQTRSGNVEDPEAAAWSAWSEPATLTRTGTAPGALGHPVEAPPARFLQYRVLMNAPADATPRIERVETAYIVPNLPPRLLSVNAEYPDPPDPGEPVETEIRINWEARDANNDRLLFDVEAQPLPGGGEAREGGGDEPQAADAEPAPFLTVATDLAEDDFAWDTRTFPAGRYRLRIRASDRLDNPPSSAATTTRVLDSVVVDNDGPRLRFDAVRVQTDKAELSGTVRDEHLPLAGLAYRVDDAEEYRPVLPEDLIFDSTEERWSLTLSALPPGSHVLTFRALDTRGNAGYAHRVIRIPQP